MKGEERTNIVLTGMAGAGKSCVGIELARLLGLDFVDVDSLMEHARKKPLQEILETLGVSGFRKFEEEILCSMEYQDHVIATGGSAVYSEAGMNHLQTGGLLVLLDVPLQVLEQRVGDYSSRGLVKMKQQSFSDLYAERIPLYRKNADLSIDCGDRSVAEICLLIEETVRTL